MSQDCFADEIAIDFPSVEPAVERMRDAFLGERSGDDVDVVLRREDPGVAARRGMDFIGQSFASCAGTAAAAAPGAALRRLSWNRRAARASLRASRSHPELPTARESASAFPPRLRFGPGRISHYDHNVIPESGN
jgi:hypothetical protein